MRSVPNKLPEHVANRFARATAKVRSAVTGWFDALRASFAADARPPHRHKSNGRIVLVGAGPGDAELLTVKAARAIAAADVILFDALVSREILEFADPDARLIPVGKRARRVSCRQDDINDLMIRLAKDGNHVVRLKSGDPMIFGRAGEEITRIEHAGIPFAIIPGITASAAMAATLGVSLTHRDHAHSVRFVTGHAKGGSFPADLDWRGLADPQTTTIVYMGARTAPEIAKRMVAEGRGSNTPAIAVANISRSDEQRWAGTLSQLAEGEAAIDPALPVLIGIGDVFSRVEAPAKSIPAAQVLSA